MEELSIEELFKGLESLDCHLDEASRRFFLCIMRSTLRFRDQMLETRGIVVTVRDVKTSLKWLVPTLATGNLPELDNPVSMELLKTWLKDLRAFPSSSTPPEQINA